MKIRNFMTRNVTCVCPTDSLKQAYDLMQDGDMRHLPVVLDDNKLVGILSDRDVLLHATWENGKVEVPDIDVSAAMSRDVVTCRPTSQMADVAETMLENKFDAIPVTDINGELLGIVTSADFVDLAANRVDYDLVGYKSIPFNFTVNRFRAEA